MVTKIEQKLQEPCYDFLRTNPHLGERIILLTLGGSHAYGTSTPTSDIDIRGCALNQKSELLGLSSFEQVTDNQTDTTIYSFNKLIKLLVNCNPNTIELLGCKEEQYFRISPIGKELLANKKMFLSQIAVQSFGGYANQQLRRLQNALARDNYPHLEKERHILGSVKSAMMDFSNRYTVFPQGSIKLAIDQFEDSQFEHEILVDVQLQGYPLRDYKNIWSDMNNIVKDYAKLNKRNNKKDDLHLNKHAQHLVRLYLMCLDILEKEIIQTYRENDLELLQAIRNGKYQKPDGSYHMDFFALIDDLEKRMEYAQKHTNLPEKPDYKQIEAFVMSVNERSICS